MYSGEKISGNFSVPIKSGHLHSLSSSLDLLKKLSRVPPWGAGGFRLELRALWPGLGTVVGNKTEKKYISDLSKMVNIYKSSL